MTLIEREILAAVAAGALSPEDAARALADLGHDDAAGAAPPPASGPADPGPAEGGTAKRGPAGPGPAGPGPAESTGFRLKVSATARSVRIIGDVGVAEAIVEGRHQAERTGDTLSIEGSVRPEEDAGFAFEGGATWHRPWHHWRHLSEPLVIRVTPSAPVEVEVSAGSVNLVGLTGPLTVVLAAGSARLDDVTGPLDLEARAGAVRISGRIEANQSHVRCEAGSVSLHLAKGSDVRVRARADLGRVRVHGMPAPEQGGATDSTFGGFREVTVGAGTGSVDIETTMGSVELFSDEWLGASSDRR